MTFTLLTSGVFYPKFASALGAVYIVSLIVRLCVVVVGHLFQTFNDAGQLGRYLYGRGYTMHGPPGRITGFQILALSNLSLLGTVV